MKNHIHTVPVLDALKDPGACPFCKMYKTLDENALHFIMGPAYMDEDVRDKTNEAGFCQNHLNKMYEMQNRLGTALLLHTHLKQLLKNITMPNLNESAGLFKKAESALSRMASQIEQQQNRCYLCEKIDDTFQKYVDTFFYMWSREAEMPALVKALPSFCMPHFGMMIAKSETALNKKYLEGFLEVVIPLQQKALSKLDEDLDWFIQKFDYRNADAPWKDSQDAIERSIVLLKGENNA